MPIKAFLYGIDAGSNINVTKIVEEHIHKYGYIHVSNTNFTDPYPYIVKKLFIVMDNGAVSTLAEGSYYYGDRIVKITTYYYILCSDSPNLTKIVSKQLDFLLKAPACNDIETVKYYITGSDKGNFDSTLQLLNDTIAKQGDKKITLKTSLDSESLARGLVQDMKSSLGCKNHILYLQTFKVDSSSSSSAYWEAELVSQLPLKWDSAMGMLSNHKYDIVGAGYTPLSSPLQSDTSPLQSDTSTAAPRADGDHVANVAGAYYSSNFWLASDTYLKSLFNLLPTQVDCTSIGMHLFAAKPKFGVL